MFLEEKVIRIKLRLGEKGEGKLFKIPFLKVVFSIFLYKT